MFDESTFRGVTVSEESQGAKGSNFKFPEVRVSAGSMAAPGSMGAAAPAPTQLDMFESSTETAGDEGYASADEGADCQAQGEK